MPRLNENWRVRYMVHIEATHSESDWKVSFELGSLAHRTFCNIANAVEKRDDLIITIDRAKAHNTTTLAKEHAKMMVGVNGKRSLQTYCDRRLSYLYDVLRGIPDDASARDCGRMLKNGFYHRLDRGWIALYHYEEGGKQH